MKTSCSIIQDLLPLYKEGLASKESVIIVDQHLTCCPDCQLFVNQMNETAIPNDPEVTTFKQVALTVQKRKRQLMLCSFLFAITLFVVVFYHLNKPRFLPYTEELITVEQVADELVVAELNSAVTNFEITWSNNNAHITTWNTMLAPKRTDDSNQIILLSHPDQSVEQVYYVEPNEGSDLLLYSQQRTDDFEGVMTLPRLALSYYVIIAGIMAFTCFVVSGLTGHNMVRTLSKKLSLLATCYVVAHLVIKGVSPTTYVLIRDFGYILVVAVTLFVSTSIWLEGRKLIAN
ncbi:Putative zinc-finger [Amphibacillus marinus]|uniref:Putative zinc-finger n=1 Tax=Amphibacillus marinus TaxID=872970 RepID=A0A1H8LMT7_9BACI|nr:zf-HC2 domain-containing protein [Amphibacillus marinus]SEO06502.1 Putative zinc-finger [Amphibacillus marinus]